MLHALQGLVGTAALERATLLLNHVVAAEPVAVARLQPFAGRCIQLQFDGWPGWLPAWPPTAFRITPAGLFEWLGDMPPPQSDLRISIDASNPALAFAQALAGERPRVDVAGDSALAGEIDWLFDNLRWDVEDDLGKVVGAAPAREIARLGRAVAAGVRSAARRFGSMPARGAPAEPASR